MEITEDKLLAICYNYDICLDTRTIFLGVVDDEIDAQTADIMLKAFHNLHRQSKDPITIIMNNPGGDYYHSMAIYDTIRTSPCKVTIIAYGHCMSMGSIIMQAADDRVMAPHAVMMIHDGEEGFNGSPKELEAYTDHSKKVEDAVMKIYRGRTGMSKKAFMQIYGTSKYFTAQETVDLGLADRVLNIKRFKK